MDQWKTNRDCSQALYVNSVPSNAVVHHKSDRVPRQGIEAQVPDILADRKHQKALKEKWRRDRLSHQFIELENLLDQGRYKKNKETLIDNTIETLLGLTAEVNRLKTEAAVLSEQSHELTRERNDLKEDTSSLKSEIRNLKNIHQQRLGFMNPWPPIIDPAAVIPPIPYYSFPVVHTFMQPFPCFEYRNPGLVPDANSAIGPHPAAPNASVNQLSPSYASSTSQISSNNENGNVSNDVDTVLELKTPGSTSQREFSQGDRKGKRPMIVEKSRKNKSRFSSG